MGGKSLASISSWMRNHRILIIIVPGCALLLGLGIFFHNSILAVLPFGSPAPQAIQTPSAIPCTPQNIGPDVERMDALMLEFYDASALASQTTAENLAKVIPSMQEIRRRADAQKVVPCLNKLKALQVAHMNTAINTMLAFMSKADSTVLIKGVAQARLLNEQYIAEKAKLLGLTPLATSLPATHSPSLSPTTMPAGSATASTPAQ
jgi:hypothetical protein